MINWTAQTVQVYKADITDPLRKLPQLDKAQKKSEQVAVAAAEKQSKSGRKLAQQMDILTMSTGGMGTEVGKAAELGKRLADGFGIMGVAMMGAGLILRELAPLVGSVVDGFSDLINYGTSEKWKPLQDRIGAITGLMRTAQLQTKLWQAQLALMLPGDRTSALRSGKEGDVSRAEDAYSAAKSASATANADVERLTASMEELGEVGRAALSKRMSALEQEARARAREVEEAGALLELRGLELQLAEQVEFEANRRSVTTETHTKSIVKQAQAIERLTAAERALLEVMKSEAAIRAGGVSGLVGLTGDKFSRAGTRAAGLLEIPDSGMGKIEAIAKSSDKVKDIATNFNIGREALDSFSDAASTAFAGMIEGTMSLKEAARSLLADFLSGMAQKLFAYSILYAVEQRWAQAAAALAGAAVVGGLARAVGGTGVPSATGGFAGAGAGNQTTNTTIFVGDSFTGMSNRRRSAELKRYDRLGRSGSYAS